MNTTVKNAEQPLELIDTILSGNGWKVRLLAGYCGVALQRRSLSIPDGDLQSDWFASVNPLRQVPVLKTREGVWLAESSAILWYLGEGTPFLPDGLQRAQILQWLMFEQTKLMWNLAQPRLWIALRATTRARSAGANVAMRPWMFSKPSWVGTNSWWEASPP
jgi:glutathione S-transferase